MDQENGARKLNRRNFLALGAAGLAATTLAGGSPLVRAAETNGPPPTQGGLLGRKIAVLGTGAIGSSVASELTRAGEDVWLIDQWPAHVEAMKSNGLHIKMAEGDLHIKVQAMHLCQGRGDRASLSVGTRSVRPGWSRSRARNSSGRIETGDGQLWRADRCRHHPRIRGHARALHGFRRVDLGGATDTPLTEW